MRPGEVRRERVDPVERLGGVDRVLVALPGEGQLPVAGGDGDVDQAGDVDPDDLPDPTFDLRLGLVVPAAQSVAHPLQRVLGLHQRALAGVRDLGRLLGGVDVRDAQLQRRVRVAARDLPVTQRALEHGPLAWPGVSLHARARTEPGAAPSWPTSARNRSRNPALARSGTTNRTPAWSISRIVLGCPIAESHTIRQARSGDRQAAAPVTRRPTSTPPRSPDPDGCRAPSRPRLTPATCGPAARPAGQTPSPSRPAPSAHTRRDTPTVVRSTCSRPAVTPNRSIAPAATRERRSSA